MAYAQFEEEGVDQDKSEDHYRSRMSLCLGIEAVFSRKLLGVVSLNQYGFVYLNGVKGEGGNPYEALLLG